MKLYFYYGVMGTSKTANALMKKFNFEECGKKVILLKPSLDSRFDKNIVKSRIGLSCEAILLKFDANVQKTISNLEYDIIIVDEAQFLSVSQIDELRNLANNGIMVMCYGLKTDYTGHLFDGTKRLMELADTIREIQSMCSRCSSKALMNARYIENKILYTGNKIIDIGGEDKYITLCHKCWSKGYI